MTPSNAKASILIKAKRLDSDETTEARVSVELPSSDLGKRTQLAEVVGGAYPDAEFRSFANDAATFLDHKVLVIAIYEYVGEHRDRGTEEEDDSEQQQQLFAA